MRENLKKRENHVQTISLGEGLRYDLSCTPRNLLNSCQIVQWDPQNVKQISPQKKFGMGYVKMHGFHGNLLYDFRDWGVGLQIQSYLGFYLS